MVTQYDTSGRFVKVMLQTPVSPPGTTAWWRIEDITLGSSSAQGSFSSLVMTPDTGGGPNVTI